MKRSELKMMKRAELMDMIIADQNRLEYLKDKVHALEEKLKGLDELQAQYEEEIKRLAFMAGGVVKIPMQGTLKDYDVKVELVKKEEA